MPDKDFVEKNASPKATTEAIMSEDIEPMDSLLGTVKHENIPFDSSTDAHAVSQTIESKVDKPESPHPKCNVLERGVPQRSNTPESSSDVKLQNAAHETPIIKDAVPKSTADAGALPKIVLHEDDLTENALVTSDLPKHGVPHGNECSIKASQSNFPDGTVFKNTAGPTIITKGTIGDIPAAYNKVFGAQPAGHETYTQGYIRSSIEAKGIPFQDAGTDPENLWNPDVDHEIAKRDVRGDCITELTKPRSVVYATAERFPEPKKKDFGVEGTIPIQADMMTSNTSEDTHAEKRDYPEPATATNEERVEASIEADNSVALAKDNGDINNHVQMKDVSDGTEMEVDDKSSTEDGAPDKNDAIIRNTAENSQLGDLSSGLSVTEDKEIGENHKHKTQTKKISSEVGDVECQKQDDFVQGSPNRCFQLENCQFENATEDSRIEESNIEDIRSNQSHAQNNGVGECHEEQPAGRENKGDDSLENDSMDESRIQDNHVEESHMEGSHAEDCQMECSEAGNDQTHDHQMEDFDMEGSLWEFIAFEGTDEYRADLAGTPTEGTNTEDQALKNADGTNDDSWTVDEPDLTDNINQSAPAREIQAKPVGQQLKEKDSDVTYGPTNSTQIGNRKVDSNIHIVSRDVMQTGEGEDEISRGSIIAEGEETTPASVAVQNEGDIRYVPNSQGSGKATIPTGNSQQHGQRNRNGGKDIQMVDAYATAQNTYFYEAPSVPNALFSNEVPASATITNAEPVSRDIKASGKRAISTVDLTEVEDGASPEPLAELAQPTDRTTKSNADRGETFFDEFTIEAAVDSTETTGEKRIATACRPSIDLPSLVVRLVSGFGKFLSGIMLIWDQVSDSGRSGKATSVVRHKRDQRMAAYAATEEAATPPFIRFPAICIPYAYTQGTMCKIIELHHKGEHIFSKHCSKDRLT